MSKEVEAGIDKEFCIWFAGFWEGEGWVSILNRKGARLSRFEVGISQCNKNVIEDIKRILGFGNVFLRSKNKLSKKLCWMWRTNAIRQVEFALRIIRPYLRFRSEQVDQVLAEIERVKNQVITHSKYSPSEIRFIRENYLKESDNWIADKLGRTGREAIRDKRVKLGLMKGHSWRRGGISEC